MPTIPAPRSKSFFPLLWVMVFDHASLNIAFPILTLLFFDMQSSLFAPETSHAVRSMWYGLCVAVPHIVNLLMTPILSAMSDAYGRKKILLIGTIGAFLFALTVALGIVWGMLSLLFLGRIIQGAFSRTNPIAQAAMGDMSTRGNKVRNMGYLQTAISIGAFVGPILGGYLAKPYLFSHLNFSLPYWVAALLASISCLLVILLFEETHPVKPNILHTFLTQNRLVSFVMGFFSFKNVLLNPKVLSISAILLLSQISWSMYYQFIPPILKTAFDFSAHALGLFVGLIALWLALATGFGIRLLDRFFSLRQMLFFSLYLVLIGLLLSCLAYFLHANHSALIWIGAIPTAVGDVVAFSCLTALYSNVVEKEEQGKVMGICFIVVAIIWSLTALLGGVLMSYSQLLPLMVAPVGIVLAIGLLHVGTTGEED